MVYLRQEASSDCSCDGWILLSHTEENYNEDTLLKSVRTEKVIQPKKKQNARMKIDHHFHEATTMAKSACLLDGEDKPQLDAFSLAWGTLLTRRLLLKGF